MPIKKIEHINNDTLWGIWEINETYNKLYNEATLAEEDNNILEGIKHPTKKLEWLAGRVLIEQLATRLNIPYGGISKDAFGKPSIKNTNAEISITHSYPYVAAVVSKTFPVGIDLEQPKAKLQAIAHKYLSDSEQLHAGDNLEKLCIYWSAKETLYKIYAKKRVIFKEHLKIAPFSVGNFGELTGEICINGTQEIHKLRYERENGFVVIFNYQ